MAKNIQFPVPVHIELVLFIWFTYLTEIMYFYTRMYIIYVMQFEFILRLKSLSVIHCLKNWILNWSICTWTQTIRPQNESKWIKRHQKWFQELTGLLTTDDNNWTAKLLQFFISISLVSNFFYSYPQFSDGDVLHLIYTLNRA